MSDITRDDLLSLRALIELDIQRLDRTIEIMEKESSEFAAYQEALTKLEVALAWVRRRLANEKAP